MGKVAKLHRRLVKKSQQSKQHKKAVTALLGVVSVYAAESNWKVTGETRDVVKDGIIIGVEQLKVWVGPGTGPEVAKAIIDAAKS